MNRRSALVRLGLAGPVAFSPQLANSAPQTIRLTFASGYPPVFSMVQDMVNVFMPAANLALDSEGKYHIEWNSALSGTLAKIPAMLDTTSNGLCDVGHIPPVFEPAKLGLATVGYKTPFTGIDHHLATRSMHEIQQQNPAFNKMYSAQNLVYLSSASLDDYVLFSKKPVRAFSDLRGVKVGGAGPNLTWIEGTGAVGVITTGAGAYNDLKSGIIDALLSPAALGYQGKYFEVAPNVLRCGLGAVSTTYIFANQTSFSRLPKEGQQALLKAGDAWQTAHMKTQDRLVADTFAGMQKGGATVFDLAPESRLAWARALPPLGLNWARDEEAMGRPGRDVLNVYMEYLRSRGAPLARDWSKA